ncbi:cytochrome c3 family protein [Shewanella schlegeliana]|uniref:Cytochrome c3 family protein n=1 Tax=Shewanella schlegeliana TaxID=190308 RepID=A0ABS1T650_9GAMM|nr:cytochrome c3 family protein [Shewanella schlegeliana]MBL4914961.1 cytochrome c3 family protein [Shewanella schlegeliana]MCL1110627.1 cytochrome c3 family protein [Shewanella schlegeliana]GIU37888.1 flavocytochrome c heme submit [Shewanella schlegeliana]
MKTSFAVAVIATLLSCSALAAKPSIKQHHIDALGDDMNCRTCHTTKGAFERPSDQACIDCHGGMHDIPTEPNRFDKNPHNSHHYEDLLECMVCHSEHKPSKDICSDCHKVEFNNLK